MSFPSVSLAWNQAIAAAKRFPMVIGAGVLAAVAAIALEQSVEPEERWVSLIAVATLGLPLFFSLTVLSEVERWDARRRSMVMAGGTVVLLVLFLLWPDWTGAVAGVRYVQFSVGFHLLCAFLPFATVQLYNGFWQYNRTLLLRFLTAAVFAGVLYAGLATALLAVDKLLGIEIDPDVYFWLWAIIAFVFNPWFFVGGIPENVRSLEDSSDYPAIVKVFAQYILIPIVTVYVLILTIYMGKIIVTATWPSGWIGYLVSTVATLGVLALLLVYPIREHEENRWVGLFARSFYIVLVPSIIMVLLAAWKRIDQYGVTEPRYILIVLSLWLAGIAAFHIARGLENIKVIPISLCFVALLTSFGPWGAFAVSRGSQERRLERLFTASGLLVDGALRPTTETIEFADRKEMSAILRYLIETHDARVVDEWTGGQLSSIDTVTVDRWNRAMAGSRAKLIVEYLGVPYVSRWEFREDNSFSHYWDRTGTAADISGYDFAYEFNNRTADTVVFGSVTLELLVDDSTDAFVISRAGETLVSIPLTETVLRINEYVRQQPANRSAYPLDVGTIDVETDVLAVRLSLHSVSGTLDDGELDINFITAGVYVRLGR